MGSRFRFLDFSTARSADLVPKSYPGPGLDSIPEEEGAALPEQDRYSGPMNDLAGGDHKNGPGRFVKDVPKDESVVTGNPASNFNSVKDMGPRSDPRDMT